MFDVTNGVITLCKSGLKIDKNTTPEDLEKTIPDRITDAYNTINGEYRMYVCWLDIEPDHLIGARFYFREKKKLTRIDIYPYSTPESPGRMKDYLFEWDITEKWLRQYLDEDEKRYTWGKITFVRGDWNYDYITGIAVKFSL